VHFRSLKYLVTDISLSHSVVDPCYDYRYHIWNLDPVPSVIDSHFVFTEARINLRYAIREELTQAFGRRFSTMSKYPVFYAAYTIGINDLWRSEYAYHKVELAMSEDARIRNLGKTSIMIEAGKIWNDVPYSRLFRGRGSRGGDISFLLANSFQTMEPDEFACDQYVNFFFRHNFGNFLFKAGKFKPEFIIAHNLMFGTLSTSMFRAHEPEALQAPEFGYYEGGLIIDNLIRLKLLNVAYLGIGGGAFYRYGHYSFDKTLDNFAFKLSFRISGN
jgi:hypothetical protein